MTAFRGLLALMLTAIVVYTAIVIGNHGFNLFPIFFSDIAAFGWPGQFNFDFLMLLVLSGLWVSWRNGFSGGGIALALVASVGSILFLASYLLILSFLTKGDIRAMVLGVHARDRPFVHRNRSDPTDRAFKPSAALTGDGS